MAEVTLTRDQDTGPKPKDLVGHATTVFMKAELAWKQKDFEKFDKVMDEGHMTDATKSPLANAIALKALVLRSMTMVYRLAYVPEYDEDVNYEEGEGYDPMWLESHIWALRYRLRSLRDLMSQGEVKDSEVSEDDQAEIFKCFSEAKEMYDRTLEFAHAYHSENAWARMDTPFGEVAGFIADCTKIHEGIHKEFQDCVAMKSKLLQKGISTETKDQIRASCVATEKYWHESVDLLSEVKRGMALAEQSESIADLNNHILGQVKHHAFEEGDVARYARRAQVALKESASFLKDIIAKYGQMAALGKKCTHAYETALDAAMYDMGG